MKKLSVIILSLLFVLALVSPSAVRADDAKKPAPKPYALDTCAVCGMKLGMMGKPYVFTYKDREIKVCEKSEEKEFLKEPAKYIKQVEDAEAKLKK